MTVRSSSIEGVDLVVLPAVRELGDGFNVRRALPSVHRRMVGPFIFLDSFGPTQFAGGQGLDVRPHPHIGLSTLTFLLEGNIVHRDSIGTVQEIQPGEVNWMTAGSGIAHSERTGIADRARGSRLKGIQTWLALPKNLEDIAPSFTHHKVNEIPHADADGVHMRLIAGAWDGLRSPVNVFSDLVYAEIHLAEGAHYQLRAGHIERAIYIIDGRLCVAGQSGSFEAGEMVIFKPDAEIILQGEGPAHFILVGGEPFPEKRFIDWNFVSSSPERIAQARQDWVDQKFATVPDEHEFIPLPKSEAPVNYP